MNGWMNKEDALYLYNGILFRHEKKWNPDICGRIMLNEIIQRKTSTVWYHFYVESKKAKFVKE